MVQICIKINDELYKKLIDEKSKHGFSTTSEVCREAIRHYIKYLRGD